MQQEWLRAFFLRQLWPRPHRGIDHRARAWEGAHARPWRGWCPGDRVPSLQPRPVEVQVITHHMQRFAVWFGGSMLASTVSPCRPAALLPPVS